MCRNSGAPWTQPVGAPTKQKEQIYSMLLCVSSCLFSSPENCITLDADMSAQFHRKSRPHLILTIFFSLFFLLPQNWTTVENKQYQRTDTAVKILQGHAHKQTVRINQQSPKDAQYFYQLFLLLETQLLWLNLSAGPRPSTSHEQHVEPQIFCKIWGALSSDLLGALNTTGAHTAVCKKFII